MKKLLAIFNYFALLDIIGPEVRFFSRNEHTSRRQSAIGGFISIIVCSLALSVSFYFLLDIFIRKNPKTYQMTSYMDDTPKIEVGTSQISFAVKIETYDLSMPYKDSYASFHAYLKNFTSGILATYEIVKCDFDRDFNDFYSIYKDYKDEINNYYYCLGDMLVNGTKIPKSSENYSHPYLEHGVKSMKRNGIYFTIEAKRCENTTENSNSCSPKEEVDLFLKKAAYYIIFADNNFDPNNYETPVQTYVNLINGRASPNILAQNYISFNNIFFNTHDGFLFDRLSSLFSYKFSERVEIVSNNIGEDGVQNPLIVEFLIIPQNSPVTYDRYYSRIQEILANIGGIVKFLFIIGQFLNSFFIGYFERNEFVRNVLKKYVGDEEIGE